MFKKVLTLFVLAAFLTVGVAGPVGMGWMSFGVKNAYAFQDDLSTKCNGSNTYGAGSSSTTGSDAAVDDMVCTIYNLATGPVGKAVGIVLIAVGFVRGAGLWGQGSLMGAAVPFLAGIGIANAEGLATAAGYQVQ